MSKLSEALISLLLCFGVVVACSGQLEKAGISTPYTQFAHCNADGTQTVSGTSQSAQVHLEITNGGIAQLTADFDGKKRSIVYSGTSGVSTMENRSPIIVPTRTALLSRFLYIPILEFVEVANDPSSKISVTGPTPLDGLMVYTLTAVGHWPDTVANATSPGPSVKYFIDASTSMIVGREDTIEDSRDHRTRYTRTFRYGNYRPSGALALPYQVIELLEGQTIATTQWNTLTVSF